MCDCKEFVLSKCRTAVAKWCEAVYEMGRIEPRWDEHWKIRSCNQLGFTVLGVGKTEQEAWCDAARKLGGGH